MMNMLKKSYYDQLFQDVEGTTKYYSWIDNSLNKTEKIIEMACGTGDLLAMLTKDYEVVGIDIDETMIQKAQNKYPKLKNHFKQGDFLDPQVHDHYDALVCINDSLNYILNEKDLEKFVEESTKIADEMFLDSHHPYRLVEFENDYIEEGSTDSFDYAYQISVEDNFLVHVINFLDGTFDSVFQWVFDPAVLIKLYKDKGYEVETFTDFDTPGISKKGEKIMYHICKGELL